MTPYRIVLADDHPLMRQGLRKIIETAPQLQVIGEADDGVELLKLLRRTTPDLVILDIAMPQLRGLEALHEIKATHRRVKVLILTMHRDRDYLSEAMAAGASGYLLKEDADTELFAAIERVREHRVYVSPRLVDDLADLVASGDRRRASDTDGLTMREREVLRFTAGGKTGKEIAEILAISPRTVEHHRARVADKLGLRRTADLVRYALANGYLQAG